MNQERTFGYILIFIVFLSSCELLSVNDDEKQNEENKKERPELIWQSGFISDLDVPAPVIEDSSVYVVNSYDLAKLNIANGEYRWITKLEGIAPDVCGDILVDDQSVYLRFEESLNRYDKSDGTLQWSTTFEDSVDRSVLPLATSLVSQSEEKVFVGTQKNVLVVDKQQGTVSRTITPEIPVNEISDQRLNVTLVSKFSGRIYILTSYSDKRTTVRGKLGAYDYTDGSLLWEFDVPYKLSGYPDVSLPMLQMTEMNKHVALMTGPAVLAVDAETGQLAWEHLFFENETEVNVGRQLVRHNNSIYASGGGNVLKLDFDGREKWKTAISLGTAENLKVAGNHVYFAAGVLPSDTAIHALRAEDGSSMYSISASGSGYLQGFTPSFDADGTFIIDMGLTSIYTYKLPE